MSAAWQTIARRIVRSVEAPDYDTRVSTAHAPMMILMFSLAIFMLINLYFWWVDSSLGWFFFWLALLISTGLLVGVYVRAVRPIAGPNATWDSDEAAIVRAAAVAGDDKLAPLAQTQPTMIATTPALGDSPHIAGLYRPARLVPTDRSLAKSLMLNIAVNFFLIGQTLFPSHSGPGDSPIPWQLIVLASIPVAVALVLLAQRLWVSRPFSATVDAYGITWQRAGKRRTLPWSAAQALCMIELPPTTTAPLRPAGPTQRIYWLQGPDGALTWASRPYPWWRRASRRASGGDPARLAVCDEQAWNLCALAAERTGLALRDVTATTAQLTQFWPRTTRMRQSLSLLPPLQIAEAVQRRIALQRARRRRWTQTLFGVEVALEVLLFVTALVLLVGVPRMYGDQLNQARQRAPIFADTLARPSGHWPDVTTSSDATFTYFDGGYAALAGSCCDLFALAGPSVSDGVVEVTIHQVSDFDLSSSGLVLHANPKTHDALVFSVSPSAGWQLQRYTLHADGTSSSIGNPLIYSGYMFFPVGAIHRGADTTNRLAVIMRGASYTFFVNGQYIGSYHDDQGDDDQGDVGQVGVYADGLGQTATFSDFAIYPAPPASPLLPA